MIKTSICGICSNECAMDVEVEDGRVVSAAPCTDARFEGCGRVCVRGLNSPDYVNHPERLKTPLRRVGEKGAGEFEAITWDEAFAEISQKLLGFREESGADSTAFFSGYSKWYRHYLQRFALSFGTLNYGTESSSCFRAASLAKQLCTGFDAIPDVQACGTLVYVARDRLLPPARRAREKGAKVIIIDPRSSKATESADLHLRPRPGSDAALALCLGNMFIKAGMADMDYIEKYVRGFDEYKDYVNQFTPEYTEALTGVPAENILRAVELIRENSPMALFDGFTGIIHHRNGVQTYRAYTCLCAILGTYGRAGGNLPTGPMLASGHPASRYDVFGFSHYKTLPQSVKIGAERYPVWDELTDEFQAMDLARHIREQTPYPLRAVFALGFNARMFPDSEGVFAALSELEFFVDAELFLTDSAKYADIVLPVASSFERDELTMPGHGKSPLGFIHRAADPGEAKSDVDILCALAKKMRLGDELLEAGPDACRAEMIKTVGCTLDELKIRGTVPLTPPAPRPDPLKTGFLTPSGKFELSSSMLEKYSFLGVSALPEYAEALEGDAEEYPFILMSGIKAGRYEFAFQSRTHRVEPLRRLHPHPTLDMSPDDMARLGISAGDDVVAFTEKGSISLVAACDRAMLPGTVSVFEDYPEADVNTLFKSTYTDPISGFPGYKALRCAVRRGKQ